MITLDLSKESEQMLVALANERNVSIETIAQSFVLEQLQDLRDFEIAKQSHT